VIRALALVGVVAAAAPAVAGPRRYGIFIGNNRGARQEVELLYAEEDASRMAETFRRLGGGAADATVIATGDTADRVREALLSVNERIRRDIADGHRDVLLFVYYSGHADGEALHLGKTTLTMDELRRLVRGSAATIRILLVDSCKSGALTRVKGGHAVAPFDIRVEDRLGAEGTALISSSAATEDSHESDELRGSIFTHYFVTGLLGAADSSGDDKVSLGEAFRYARDNTVRYSSQTQATQHPTFELDLKGADDVALTDLALGADELSTLELAQPGHYFVFKDSESGAVVAELRSAQPHTKLVLRPGAYFVRRHDSDALRQGRVRLARGQSQRVDAERLEQVAFARLVRKGGADVRLAHAVGLYYRFRGEILSGLGPMQQSGVRYALELPALTLATRLGYGRAGAANSTLRSTTSELEWMLEILKAIDWSRLSFALGIELGVDWIARDFDSPGDAPHHDSAALATGVVGRLQVALGERYWVALAGEGVTYVLRQRGQSPEAQWATPLVGAFLAASGLQF
jgi:hypothetical protein